MPANDISLPAAVLAKQELADGISRLIDEFTQKTGLVVNRIALTNYPPGVWGGHLGLRQTVVEVQL